MTATTKCCAFCLLTSTGVSAFHTDFSGMTVTLFIVHTFCSLTVNLALWRCLFHNITVTVSIFSLFKAVTACILCMFCRASTYFDTIKIMLPPLFNNIAYYALTPQKYSYYFIFRLLLQLLVLLCQQSLSEYLQ